MAVDGSVCLYMGISLLCSYVMDQCGCGWVSVCAWASLCVDTCLDECVGGCV